MSNNALVEHREQQFVAWKFVHERNSMIGFSLIHENVLAGNR